MSRSASKTRDASNPGSPLWLKLSGPVLFALWTVLYFQGEVRGASGLLRALLLLPVVAAICGIWLLRRFFEAVAEESHEVVSVVAICAVFFVCWATASVLAEEFYLIVDGNGGRRIYTDDSGMGYATGLTALPGLAGAALIGGSIFGAVWGTLLCGVRKIFSRLENPDDASSGPR